MIELATLPAVVGLFYMYIRDKYEKEPYLMAFVAFFLGISATFLIYGFGEALERSFPHTETPLYTAFVSSAFVEESVKFIFLYYFIWRNKNFNEPFDGIVYAVFISLGFAWVENLVYVLHPTIGGLTTGFSRAVFSVPSHGLFGVQMGYFFALAKFHQKKSYLSFAFFVPYVVHAFYNYFLLKESPVYWIPFVILEILLWLFSLDFIRKLLEISPFRTGAKILS
ncbi:MAG: PrsW family glutamic-type intramembrane protease [Bacillota bacterium]